MNGNIRTKCCFCDFTSNERGVKTHIPLAHPEIVAIRKIAMHGRPKGKACKLYGMIHELPRPGALDHRRKLERPKAAVLVGRFPKDHSGDQLLLGSLTVPDGMTGIKGIKVWAENPGQIKLVVSGREYVFDVGPGYVRAVA